MNGMHPDYRGFADGAKTMWEQEQQKRFNPYGPARPSTGLEPPTRRERMRLFWSRLRALWPLGRKSSDDAQGN